MSFDLRSIDRCDMYPVASGFGNVFTDLLWRQTERTNLGSECGGGTNLTTSGTKVAIQKQLVTVLAIPRNFKFTYMTFTSLGSNLGAAHFQLAKNNKP